MILPNKPRPAVFTPKPWKPLTDSLFGIVPPDTKGGDSSPEGEEWYDLLTTTTALAVRYQVDQVGLNHSRGRAVLFQGRQLGHLLGLHEVIHTVFLDGSPSTAQVGSQLGRLVKTVGLVVYDPAPGPRFRWPMATRQVTQPEAEKIVDDAFHGIYRHPSDADEADA